MTIIAALSKPKPNPPVNLKPGEFPYRVTGTKKVSATVWKDNKMVRTIFSNAEKTAGNHIGWWDGKDDFGNVLPAGSYEIKGASSAIAAEWQGAIGNTSTDKTGENVHRGFERAFGVAIAGSYMYIAIGYNEGRNSQMKVLLSNPQENLRAFQNSVGADQDQESNHVCTDGTRVYWAGVDPKTTNKNVSFIFGTSASNDSEYLFSGGVAYDCLGGRTYAKAISIVTNNNGRITGMAVQSGSSGYLYVARKGMNQLFVYDKITGTQISGSPFTFPGANKVAVDSSNNVWVQAGTTITKHSVNGDGSLTAPTATINTGIVSVEGMGCNGTDLWVMDGGSSQQIKVFNSSGTLTKTLGQAGGYATNASVANDKFYFNDPANRINTSAIAFAGDGSYWFVDPGNYRIQKNNSSDVFQTRIQYMPHLWSARAFKDGSTVRVFAEYLEFTDDPTEDTATSWTHTKNWGYNVPANRDDEYNRLAFVSKLSNGRTYALQKNGEGWEFAELVDGGALRMTGVMISGSTYPHSQLYPDSTIRRQNAQNSVTNAPQHFYKIPLTFNGSNNPVLGTQTTVQSSPPKTANDPLYWGTRPVGYSAGEMTSDGAVITWDPNSDDFGSNGHHLGKIKDGQYVWKTMFTIGSFYRGEFTKEALFDDGNAVGNAGGRMFVIDDYIFVAYHGEFWKSWTGEPGQTNIIFVFNKDGIMVGQFGTTYWDIKDEGEAAAEMVGNGFYISLVKEGSDYYLYQNDESFHGGVTRWKITGVGGVETWKSAVTISQPVPKPASNKVDLLQGLPHGGVNMANGNGWALNTNFITSNETTNYWRVRTGLKSDRKDLSADIYAEFAANTTKTEAITRVLPAETVSEFIVEGVIHFDRNYPNTSNTGVYFEVLDVSDKVLSRFYEEISLGGSFPITVKGNGVTIAGPTPESDIKRKLEHELPIKITVNSSGVKFEYADYAPITTAILDGTADRTKPGKIRIYFFFNPTQSLQKKFGITELFYSRTLSTPTDEDGIWYTGNEITNWRQRLRDKKIFYNKGDVKSNSPGIASGWIQRANELVNNPYIDRYTGPTYYLINNSGSQISLAPTDYIRDFSYPESQRKGDRIFCAAILGRLMEGWDDVNANRYKNAVKTALLDAFGQNINQFPDYSSAWPGNGTRWNPSGHHGYQNPMFVFGQFFKNGFKSYDLLKNSKVDGVDLFSSGNKTTLTTCFNKAAKYMCHLNNNELDNYLTNRDVMTNINLEGQTIIGDQGKDTWRLFDGGPYVSRMARHWNNRSAEQLYFALLEGIRTNDTFLINSFYVYFKEWVTYSMYKVGNEVYLGEMERGNNSSFREHGYSYSTIMLGMMWSGAWYFDRWLKKNPNPAYHSLLDWTTSNGMANDTAGGPKGIKAAARTLLKLPNRELKLTYGGEPLDGILTSKNWEWIEDTTLAAMVNITMKDDWFKKSYLREHPQSYPFPPSPDGSGAWIPGSGWGGTEYNLFFYAYNEGVL